MVDLEVRRLGRTEMKPKALGLGGGYLGLPELMSEEEATATIRAAIERGINFIDTAPPYGDGESERCIGLALAGGWREKVYLQTKVGSHPRFFHDFSKEATLWSLENSFKQLQTDYVDSVLIHGPRYDMEPLLAPGACLDVLLDWKAQGRIGHLGIAVRQHEFHQQAIETGHRHCVVVFGLQLAEPVPRQNDHSSGAGTRCRNHYGQSIGRLTAGRSRTPARERKAVPRSRRESHTGGHRWAGRPRGGAARTPDVAMVPRTGLNIRDLAVQFALNAPVAGNGIILVGPANRRELAEVYASATTEVPEAVWQDFEAEFGVGI